ncbi:ribonuclease T2-like [Cotesia glomerata]|uniref:ribonuclease T2-like n=1 Tax=Cotesia glomerata TaxID=32391 RepID=UPI001D018C9E|nr:ribonuclease T2-like [Cotesia glomerata]
MAPYSQINEISDLTCVDNNSPADQCFHYLILSVFWSRGLGLLYQLQGKKTRPHLVNQDYWAIHGLWPAVINGNVPRKCIDQNRRSQFNANHFKNRRDNLYKTLENRWFNILDIPTENNAIEKFWRHEYDKHGCCAARAESITNDVGYFKSAINMYNNINPSTVVKKSGLDIGQTALLGTFYDALIQNIGSKVKIQFVDNRAGTEKYLTEIRVCYDLSLRKIDCPGYHGPSSIDRSFPLRLLSRMP